jgi:hypothetical protein
MFLDGTCLDSCTGILPGDRRLSTRLLNMYSACRHYCMRHRGPAQYATLWTVLNEKSGVTVLESKDCHESIVRLREVEAIIGWKIQRIPLRA